MCEWRSWEWASWRRQADCRLENRLGKDVRSMRGELRAGKFNWQLATLGHIVEGDPSDVVLDCVWMRDFLADGDFDVKRLARSELPSHGYDRDMFLCPPVGGFDVISEAHGFQFLVPSY